MLKAIVFDFDGVMVDSEPVHYQAFLEVAREEAGFQFDYPHYLQRYIGYDDRDAFRAMLADAGVPREKITRERVARLCLVKGDRFEAIVRRGMPTIPGSVELVRQLRGRMPIAICSGATRRDIDVILHPLGLEQAFDLIISADLVAKSKPDPTSYRVAVEQLSAKHPALSLRAGDCLAIEDTEAGIESALGAGLKVLALSTTSSPQQLRKAQRVEPNLASVDLKKLQQWFN